MKFANGSEELQMHTLQGAKKHVEEATEQSVSEPIIYYNHEPRPRLVSGNKSYLDWFELIQLSIKS